MSANNVLLLVLLIILLAGCVYAPKDVYIEELWECPIEDIGGIA